MSEFRVAPIHLFDSTVSDTETYLVCSCGFPVWHMADVYFGAGHSMAQCAKAWKRKHDMKAAGGKHTRQEIDRILQLQEGRCIYCHTLFTETTRPTRDHLVPLSCSGTGWALNLVLACRPCNSRRGQVPFRAFCRLLSPRQNERVLQHLLRRIRAVDLENPAGGWDDFQFAMLWHLPNDRRYKMIQSMRPRYQENTKRNKLLPRGVFGILNEALRKQRIGNRRNQANRFPATR